MTTAINNINPTITKTPTAVDATPGDSTAFKPDSAVQAKPEDLIGMQQLTGAELEAYLRATTPQVQPTPPAPPSPPRRPRVPEYVEAIEEPAAAPPSNTPVPPDVEPWPEPVIGADVLNEISATISRYVVLQEGAADAVALWIAHTHCYDSFQCTPRLNLSSPERGCGKTTLRDVIAALVPRPLLTEHMTRAVLFRLIDEQHPTVLADECDAWLMEDEQLRGLLNSGHRRGAQLFRCNGRAGQVRGFNVFAPVVLCGIGGLPVTLKDRSITVSLKRARPGEIQERFDSRRVEGENELRRRLARYCADNQERLATCEPRLPASAVNRTADNWRPLFAIAEAAGGGWPRRAARAFARLAVCDMDEQGTGAMLLADIQQVFTAGGGTRIFSSALVDALCAMAERPWLEAHNRRRINPIWLANQLRPYGITPITMRIGRASGKGYNAADFQDAFDRYLPAPGRSGRNSVTRR